MIKGSFKVDEKKTDLTLSVEGQPSVVAAEIMLLGANILKGSIKEYLKTEINMEEKKAALIEANLLGEVIRSLEDYRKDIYATYENEELDKADEEREDIIKGTVKFAFADLSEEGE